MKKMYVLFGALLLVVSSFAQTVKPELNLTKGEKYRQEMLAAMTIKQTMLGQPIDINMAISATTEYKVNDIQNGIYSIEVAYVKMIMRMGLPSGTMDYSSDKKDESDILSTLLSTMINRPFTIKLTKTGRVLEVNGIDQLFSGMFDKFPALSEAQKQQIKAQLTQSYGKESFKSNFEMTFAVFPENPVSIGSKWNVNTKNDSGMSLDLQSTYELKEVGDSWYLIGGTSAIQTANKDAVIQTGGMDIKYNLSGTMLSEIKVDKKTGWIIESSLHQSIEGSTQIMNNTQFPDGITVPLSMRNEMKVYGK